MRLTDYQYKRAFKAQIDVAYDCTVGDMMEWLEQYNLACKLVHAVGPGGGNPCFELAAVNKNDLLAALSDHSQCPVSDCVDMVYT